MTAWYAALKVIHVLSVVVWIGGAAALAMVTAHLLRARDHATLAALLPLSTRFFQTMGGPASGLVLLSGIAMVILGRIGFGTLWVTLGFLGILIHFLYGAIIMRRRTLALSAALSAAPVDAGRIAAAGRRLRTGSLVYLLIMAAVIVVMVAKPTG